MDKSVKCQDTLAIQTHRIMPSHTNSFKNLFGGQLLYWLDNAASISQTRLTNTLSMTVSLDNMNFLRPLPEGNSVCIESYVSGTGNTSVEVFAKIIGEDLLTGERYIAATSFLTFVALPKDKDAFHMPKVLPETKEEEFICAGYESRRAERIAKRELDKDIQKHLTLTPPWQQNHLSDR